MVFSLRKFMASTLVTKLDKSRLNTAIWTVRISFLLIGIISTVLLLKNAIPYSLNLIVSSLPRFWSSFRGWLSPPYLYVIVNFIIITIAASSSFQQKLSDKKIKAREPKHRDSESSSLHKTSPQIWSHISSLTLSNEYSPDSGEITSEILPVNSSPPKACSDSSCVTDSDERPPVSARLSVRKSGRENYQRKTVQSAANSVGVAKPKKHDTLEATWREITENRGKPQTRHLKKSDTWDAPPHVEVEPMFAPAISARRELRKSETFNDATSSASSESSGSRGSGGLRRERLLSQDDLNRRVEAFIKKFNDEIRLERQESYKHYMEMVNRGCY
ncbi:uncharacterized protein LOC143886878 [Tasmannia lanceolata]|uniref:uncharacterized protein LOC143886878 n=1 Tax=Tasmannia lanceolata TaxID=3420 RepID=UPI00406283A4